MTIKQLRKLIAESHSSIFSKEDILGLLDNCQDSRVDLNNFVDALEEVIDTVEWVEFLQKDSLVCYLEDNKVYPEYFTLDTAELTEYFKQEIIESIEFRKSTEMPIADLSDQITKTEKSGTCGSIDCVCKKKKNKKK